MAEDCTRRGKARQQNPSCMKCGSITANTGAGSAGHYVYTCTKNDCKYVFQQVPPNQLQPGEIAQPKEVIARKCKAYACRRCGAFPKKGHVCNTNLGDDGRAKKARTQNIDTPSESQNDTLNLPPLASQQLPLPMPALSSASASTSSTTISIGTYDCLLCGKAGTHQAGCEDSLLRCESCHKFNIHILGCLREFTMSWHCPVCTLAKSN